MPQFRLSSNCKFGGHDSCSMTITIYFLRSYEATVFKHISKSIIRATVCMCRSQCLVVRGEEEGNSRFCSSRFTPCGMWRFFNWQNANFSRKILKASGKNGGRIIEFYLQKLLIFVCSIKS